MMMLDNSTWDNPYRNPNPYVPASLSEIYDYIAILIGGAPTFIDRTGVFPDRNIDSVFSILLQSFEGVRTKLGEDRYAAVVDLAARMKALFAADPEDKNGKTNEGYKLIWEMEDVIQTARRRRTKMNLPDDEGEVTGD